MNMETIFFGQGRNTSAGHQADWGRDAMRNKVITPVDLENWAIFYTRNNASDVMNYVQEVTRVGPQLGIQVRMPVQIQLPDDKTETVIKELRKAINPRVIIFFQFTFISPLSISLSLTSHTLKALTHEKGLKVVSC